MVKTIVIGLDGATWRLLDKIENSMPFLAAKKKEGSYGTLKTVVPTGSAAAWTSFSTGKNPGKHGIISWETRPFSQKIVTSSDIKQKEIWDILSERGIKCGVMCPPVSFPPKAVNGFYVSGMTRPSAEEAFYPGEDAENARLLEDVNMHEYMKTHTPAQALAGVKELAEKKTELFTMLMKKHEADFGFLLYDETDKMQHFFWEEDAMLKDFYSHMDLLMEKLCAEFKDANIFMISDHGFHDVPERNFHVNTWLMKNGYIKTGTPEKIRISLYPLGRKVARLLFRDGEVPGWLKRFAPHQETIIRGIKNGAKESADFIAFNNFSLFVKDKTKAEEIKKRLEKYEDRSAKIFKNVWLKQEVYEGDLDALPDIVFLMDERYTINTDFSPSVFTTFRKAGWQGYHTYAPDGILLSFGPGIKENVQIENAKITDMMPTILHMMGVPVPEGCDGTVLKNILKAGKEVEYSKEETAAAIARKELRADEEELVKKKLRDLGYM